MRVHFTGAWLSRLFFMPMLDTSLMDLRSCDTRYQCHHLDKLTTGIGYFRWMDWMIGLCDASLQYQKLAHDKGIHAVTTTLPTKLASWRPELATVHFRQSSSRTLTTIGLASIFKGAVSACRHWSHARPVSLRGVYASASKAPCKLTIGCCGSSARLDVST